MIINVPSRGAEYPPQDIDIPDSHYWAGYIAKLHKKGLDWDSYQQKLASRNEVIVLAEKSFAEVLKVLPPIAAIILPLALEMTSEDLVTRRNSAWIFQDIADSESKNIPTDTAGSLLPFTQTFYDQARVLTPDRP